MKKYDAKTNQAIAATVAAALILLSSGPVRAADCDLIPGVIVPTAERSATEWRWTDQKPADGWEIPGFDDKVWNTGKSGFGTEGTPGAIVGTKWNTSDIWIRREFVLPEGKLEEPVLRVHHDEDAEIFINGKPAAKLKGYISDYEDIEMLPEARAAMKPGKNIMAVHCRQTAGAQYIDVGLVDAAKTQVKVTVTDRVMVEKPASPQLVSGFFELAFGRSDLVLAELLFDRGFEMTDQYTLNDGGGWCQYVKPKPEMEDWWHSGYEEHRWYLAKAKDDTNSILDRASGTWPLSPNGKYYMVVHNKSKKDPVSLAQDGVWVRSGMTYDFSGLLCDHTMFSAVLTNTVPVQIEVCLFKEKKLDEAPLASAIINCDATTCRKFTAKLTVPDYTGRATFALRVGAGKRFACDMLSLMPSDNVEGFRRDAVEVMKQVPVSTIRYPGGCFASSHMWRDAVGDRDSRPVDTHHWWNFPFLNDFGTVEFLKLCREIGCEPMMCVPVMLGDAENAADWVAFCNTENHPLHKKAGVTKIIKKAMYWELDNETYRRMDPITYANKCVEFSRAMKKVDPEIKVIMDCYWIYHGRLQDMLDIAGPDIDLINNRGGGIDEFKSDVAIIERYNKQHKRDIKLCHSEYRASNYDLPVDAKAIVGDTAGLNQPKSADAKDTILAKASRWSYGLSVLNDFINYQKLGGTMAFANFTSYNDGWGEGLFNCAKSKAYPSLTGRALTFLRSQEIAWPLETQLDEKTPFIRTQVAWDLKKKQLILFVLNLSCKNRTVAFDVSQVGAKFKDAAKVEALWSPDVKIFAKEELPNPLKTETSVVNHDGKTIVHRLKPYSVTAIKIAVK